MHSRSIKKQKRQSPITKFLYKEINDNEKYHTDFDNMDEVADFVYYTFENDQFFLKHFLDGYNFNKHQFNLIMEYIMGFEPEYRNAVLALGRMSINGHLIDEYLQSKKNNVIVSLPVIDYTKKHNYLLDDAIALYYYNSFKKSVTDIHCTNIETSLHYLKPQLNFMYRLSEYWISLLLKYVRSKKLTEHDKSEIDFLFEKIPPLEYHIIVYRGLKNSNKSINFTKTIYVSTSLCYTVADNFANENFYNTDMKNICLIKLMPGSKMLPLFVLQTGFAGEMEILLTNNNHSFIVTNSYTDSEEKYIHEVIYEHI